MLQTLRWIRSHRVEFIRTTSPLQTLAALSLLAWLSAGCHVYDSDLINQVHPLGAHTQISAPDSVSDASAETVVLHPRSAGQRAVEPSEPEDEPDAALPPYDACPDDPHKTAPGKCGCGMVDADDDADGTANCSDACPRDPQKTRPGLCGCGRSDTDADGDGTLDCLDECPKDPHKTAPGICGCGVVDPPPSAAAPADELCTRPPLVHRYRFDGTGTALVDDIGAANGTVLGGSRSLLGSGVLALKGGADPDPNKHAYAALPAQVWKGLGSATFELWVMWRGAAATGGLEWQRLFDVGDQVAGQAHTYLFLSPSGKGGIRCAFSLDAGDPNSEVSLTTSQPLPTNTLKHLAVVVDETASTLTLYVDGAAQRSMLLPAKLSAINAQNVWLGRSNFREDPDLYGDLYEFRIYASALTARELRASFDAGPDAKLSP